MSKIGNRIKTRRTELNMSQDELAKKMGYKTRSSINKIETGKNDVTQSKIEAFAKALDTTPAYLMGWSVSNNIKKARAYAGLNQKEMALALNVSVSTVAEWENGENDPSNENLKKLSELLDQSVDFLLGHSSMLRVKSGMAVDPWADEFCRYVNEHIAHLTDEEISVLKSKGVDIEFILWSIGEGKAEFSFDEACEIADQLGLSMDEIIGWKKKPAIPEGDELTAKKRALIEKIKNLDDSDIDVVSATADAIIARRDK